MKREGYGEELVLDVHNCDLSKFNKEDIENFFIELCDIINMERCDLHFWEDEYLTEEEKTNPVLSGISAVQFIKTSSITLHALNLLRKVFINIFSCKPFDTNKAAAFSEMYFAGDIVSTRTVNRV